MILATSSALAEDFDVCVVTEPGGTAELPDELHVGFRVHECPPPWTRRGWGRIGAWVAGADLVIIEGSWHRWAPAIALLCRRTRVPYWYAPHGSLSELVRHRYPRKHLKKLAWWWLAERRVVAGSYRMWVGSHHELERARGTFPGMSCEPFVMPFTCADLGVAEDSPDRDGPHAHTDPGAGTFTLLTLARIDPIKDLPLLLTACAAAVREVPGLRLEIAGEGDPHLRARLVAQANSLGIADRVTWLGFLAGSEKVAVLHRADAYVCPGPESFGMAVVEALSAGLPVLINDEVGVHAAICPTSAPPGRAGAASVENQDDDLAERDRTGWVTAYGDAGQLAEAIVATASSHERDVGAARALFEREFSAPAFRRRFLSVWPDAGSKPNPR